MDSELRKSIKRLIEELQFDEQYYYAWQANIAMAFYDCYHQAEDKNNIHWIANKAAKRFLDTFCMDSHQPEEAGK